MHQRGETEGHYHQLSTKQSVGSSMDMDQQLAVTNIKDDMIVLREHDD